MLNIRTTTGKIFDLIPGTKLSIEENSPIFSNAGSFSLPLDLPATDNNLAILDFPYRADRRKQFITSIDVVVSCETWIRHARMDVESSGKNTNIVSSLFFRESPFYQQIKNKNITDIFKGVIRRDYENSGDRTKVFALWYDHLNKVMCGDMTDDFFVFPVCVNIEHKEKTNSENDITITESWSEFTIMNRPIVPDKDGGGLTDTDKNNQKYYMLAGTLLSKDKDGKTYRLPDGYGWAPFLRFTYVLKKLFSELGYQLKESIFDTDSSFSKLCFVHNTIDCMVNGYIDYSQLLPSIEVNKFLEFVENSFGCRFIIDETNKTATPVFWKDLFSLPPVTNISTYYEDHAKITFAKPTSLQLTINRSQEESTPIRYQSFQEMFVEYGQMLGAFKDKAAMQAQVDMAKLTPGVYFLQNSRMYVALEKVYADPAASSGTFSWSITALERNTLDYYTVGLEAYESKSTGINTCSLVDVPLRGATDLRLSGKINVEHSIFSDFLQKIIDKGISMYNTDDGIIARIPFINSVRHLNTVLETTTTTDNKTTTTIQEESETSSPMFLCQAHGRAKADPDRPNVETTFLGTPDAYDNVGNKIGSFDLSTFSLYNNFWRQYDQLLKTSLHVISGKAQMSIGDVMSFRFDRPCLLDGQKVIPISLQYELTDAGVDVIDLTVKIIKEYE